MKLGLNEWRAGGVVESGSTDKTLHDEPVFFLVAERDGKLFYVEYDEIDERLKNRTLEGEECHARMVPAWVKTDGEEPLAFCRLQNLKVVLE